MALNQPTTDTHKAPFKSMPLRRPRVLHEQRGDGSWTLASDYVLPPAPQSLFHLFATQAEKYRDKGFLAQRSRLPDGGLGDWRRISYNDALSKSRAIAHALIERGLGPDSSIMVLSGPSIEHALLMLGAFAARAPYTPVSPGYSLHQNDFSRLQHVFKLTRPAMIFADYGPQFEQALQALPLRGVEVISVVPPVDTVATPFSELLEAPDSGAVDTSLEQLRPDTHARTLFTSGSTGPAKGVIHTHGMISSYIAQQEAMFLPGRYGGEPLLSWLPWSHLGGATSLTMTIHGGTTLYIDEGSPGAGKVQETLRNLREIAMQDFPSPPALFSPLVAALEKDTAFRDFFFSKLQLLVYGAASLSQDILDRLQALSVAATGYRTPVTSKYATTETLGISQVPWPLEKTGDIGVPNAGVTIKLAPVGDLFELRVKGPCVTPGYLNDPEATAIAFDEEGYFRTGDAARLIDPGAPEKGLQFDGRIAENFKLANGSWVHVGELRTRLIEALGVVRDCVIAGPDRDDVRALVWLLESEAAAFARLPENASIQEIVRSEHLASELERKLNAYNAVAGGETRQVKRIVLLTQPPTAREITDKGSINQRAFIRGRSALLDTLYAEDMPTVTIDTGHQFM